jgi:hypothetical protein
MMQAWKQARAAVSMLSPEHVLSSATRRVRIALAAASPAVYAAMEEYLAPCWLPPHPRMAARSMLYRASEADAPEGCDLALCQDGIPCPPGAFVLRAEDPDRALAEAVRHQNDFGLPFARYFPVFRRPVTERIVWAIARENGLFTLATALPNVMPSLLELPWAVSEFASDTTFLTVNQVRMAFLIAAACGGEPGLARQRTEVAAIVAGAFGWRALARELAGKIPLGGGLIAKGAIAYAGTFVVGKGLALWHMSGRKQTRDEKRRLYQEGLEQGREVTRAAVRKL